MKKNDDKKLSVFVVTFVLGILLAILLVVNSLLWQKRIDFSRDKVFTLAPFTKNLLLELTSPVQITYYVSDALKARYPSIKDVSALLDSFASINKNITISKVDPKGAEERLNALGIQPQQIQSTNKDEVSFATVYSAITIEKASTCEVIPFVLTTDGLEFELVSRLQYLINGKPRSAYITLGNGEDLSTMYPYIVPWLSSAGFVVQQVLPSDLSTLDASVPLLVLGSKNFSSRDVSYIEDFIMRGANAVFCVSSHSVNTTDDWSCVDNANDYLLDLLNFWGIEIAHELVLDVSNYRITMQSQRDDGSTYNEYINYPFWLVTQGANIAKNSPLAKAYTGLELYWPNYLILHDDNLANGDGIIDANGASTIDDGASIIETNTAEIESLIKSSTYSWSQKPPYETDPFKSASIKPKDTTQYTVGASITGRVNGFYNVGKSEPTKIIVIADELFPSYMIEYTNSPTNMDFLVSLMLYASGEEEILQMRNKGVRTTHLNKITDEEEFASEKQKVLFLCFVFPLMVIVFAALVIARHRRRKIYAK